MYNLTKLNEHFRLSARFFQIKISVLFLVIYMKIISTKKLQNTSNKNREIYEKKLYMFIVY